MSEPTFEELMGTQPVESDEDLEEGARLRAHDLFVRLQGTFSEPAYVTIEEVRDATGFDGHRTADAIAISLYRSRGKAIWGFEMKVSRNDWLKELKQPEKAESIMRYCDYWALVVSDKAIVKDGELPPTWGMYVAQKNRLKCVVPCPKLTPLPMSLTMLTALIYAVNIRNKRAGEADLKAKYDEGYAKGKLREFDGSWEKLYQDLKAKVDTFESASGLTVAHGWQGPQKIGAAVNTLLTAQDSLKHVLQQAQRAAEQSGRIKEELQRQAEALKQIVAGNLEVAGDENDA